MRHIHHFTLVALFWALFTSLHAQTYTAVDIANSLLISEDGVCPSLEQAADMGLPFALECSSDAITVGLEGNQLVIKNTGKTTVLDVRLHYINHEYIHRIAVDAESERAFLEYVNVLCAWEELYEYRKMY